MATQKTWTAADITKNKSIVIYQLDNNVIRFIQNYQFKNTDGNVIEALGERENIIDIAFTSLPTSIQNALITIRDHLYNTALTKEGMA